MKFLRLPPWTYNHSVPAFTLIECCLVVALLGLMMFLTGAQSLFLHRLLVRTELEHLYTTCYYLQRKAMITQQPQKLILQPDTNSYSYNGTCYSLPTHVRFGCPDGAQGPPAHPATVITKPITFINNAISFAPSGVMQAGTAYLIDRNGIHGYALSCAVAQVSYLRKYQYNGQWEQI